MNLSNLFRVALLAHFGLVAVSVLAEQPKLDVNDVSWLWPAPQQEIDLASLIGMSDLKSSAGEDVWSDSQFADLLKVVKNRQTEVDGSVVEFGDDLKQKRNWHIAGMRVDPSAPGCSSSIRGAFGGATQIRLIVQPISRRGRSVEVHDVAVHLVYEWTKGVDEKKRSLPDDQKFREIIADLDRLKTTSTSGGAPTGGKPLGIHPGLAKKVPGLNADAKAFLSKHLENQKLSAIALMGLQSGVEPWIFLALTRLPDGHFGPIPVPIPSAAPQMLDFRSGGEVAPEPIVNNRSPITPQRMVPEGERRGVSTAVLFGRRFSLPNMNANAVIGKDSSGNVVFDPIVRNKDIPDVIANPLTSHFFNTDCVSCHTETARRINLNLTQGNLAFRVNGQPPRIQSGRVPTRSWNVRNFGWFPPSFFIGGGDVRATVTQRTANETAEVVEFIERNFRNAHVASR